MSPSSLQRALVSSSFLLLAASASTVMTDTASATTACTTGCDMGTTPVGTNSGTTITFPTCNLPSCGVVNGIPAYLSSLATASGGCVSGGCQAGDALAALFAQGYTCGDCSVAVPVPAPDVPVQNAGSTCTDQMLRCGTETTTHLPQYLVKQVSGSVCNEACAGGTTLSSLLDTQGYVCGACPASVPVPAPVATNSGLLSCDTAGVPACGQSNGIAAYTVTSTVNGVCTTSACLMGADLSNLLSSGYTCQPCPLPTPAPVLRAFPTTFAPVNPPPVPAPVAPVPAPVTPAPVVPPVGVNTGTTSVLPPTNVVIGTNTGGVVSTNAGSGGCSSSGKGKGSSSGSCGKGKGGSSSRASVTTSLDANSAAAPAMASTTMLLLVVVLAVAPLL